MTERTWRQKCGRVGVVVVGAGFLAYAGKLVVSRNFVASHSGAMATWAEIGFLLGVIGVILVSSAQIRSSKLLCFSDP